MEIKGDWTNTERPPAEDHNVVVEYVLLGRFREGGRTVEGGDSLGPLTMKMIQLSSHP